MPYQVLIVDDFQMARTVFEHAVENSADFALAGTLTTAGEAPEYVQTHEVDLVILDVVMSEGISGLGAARLIKETSPGVKILMVTSMPEVSYMERARSIGVESFWYKEVQERPILEVMERTMAGESVYPDHTPVVELGNTVSTELTDRELDVLRELTDGASNKEIADSLGISERTVKMHINNMLAKTGFRSRLELAIKARTGGIVIHD